MLFAKVALAAILVCPSAGQDATILLQSSVESSADRSSEAFGPALGPALGQLSVVESFGVGSSGELVDEGAPEWCKNETQLSWKQRKERMQQRATLEWCRSQVKQLRIKNDTIPDWMQKIVEDDENKGKMKWAADEYRRMQEQGKANEAPAWMVDLAQENNKWANRWASCKAAELRSRNEEVPKWMDDNAHKGIMDYAAEKAQEIQTQIDELEQEKDQEEFLVQSNGDTRIASERMLARNRLASVRTVSQQFRVLEEALAELETAEGDMKKHHGSLGTDVQLKHAGHKAKEAVALLNRLLDRKISFAAASDVE